MKTILISFLFVSRLACGQLQQPAGLERYNSNQDASNSYHLDIYPDENVLYTYIVYDSLDGKVNNYLLDLVWFEFKRILYVNDIPINEFGVIVTQNHGDIYDSFDLSIFDLLKGYEFELLKPKAIDPETGEPIEVYFGFYVEWEGWIYAVHVSDEYIYTTVETTDAATVKKFEKKYPLCVTK